MSGLNLSAGEKVIFQGHPSWRAILGFYLKGVLIAVVIGVIVKLIGVRERRRLPRRPRHPRASPCSSASSNAVATTYTITNRRLNIKRGIVSREVQETRLERVQNVNYNQSVYQRVMQIGDVDFDTAATDDYNFVFYGVANPADVVHEVDRATGSGAAGSHGLGEAQPPGEPGPPA